MAKKASPAVRHEALVVAVTKLATDFGTWKTGWGEVNRFQRVSGAIVQPFNDSLPASRSGLRRPSGDHWDTRPVTVPPGGFPHRRHRLEAADGGTG